MGQLYYVPQTDGLKHVLQIQRFFRNEQVIGLRSPSCDNFWIRPCNTERQLRQHQYYFHAMHSNQCRSQVDT